MAWLIVGLGLLLGIPVILWGWHEWQRKREAARVVTAIIRHDETELLRLLAERTDFDTVAEWFGGPALILAVKSLPNGKGDENFAAKAAQILISHGADVNEQGTEWKTALMHAASTGDLGLCALLLSHGADAGAHDMFDRTAACWAQLGGHHRVAFVLRKAEY